MSVNAQDWLDLQVSQIPLEQVARAHWQYADGESLQLIRPVKVITTSDWLRPRVPDMSAS
ncbi:hypothetical protein ULG90_23995 [Halopseudomonas pachastrellae]|nr:hypothetical protein ULG90_23995 [Halopseudomonas pachastrellae]